MRVLRTVLIVLAAVLVAGSTVAPRTDIAAAQAATYGIAYLTAPADVAAAVWTTTPLQVSLPHAGTYAIDADVRGRLSAISQTGAFITARLFDVTAGIAVPTSERLVIQVIALGPAGIDVGGNTTVPISGLVTVGAQTTIQLQATFFGSATIAQLYSDNRGRTALRFQKIG
jgi:hypothetical protein